MDIANIKLNNGITIPQIGLGTWLNKDKKECFSTVKYALDIGYRHIDTAQAYSNEEFIGEAIKRSGVQRKDIFITTKIWTENLSEDRLQNSFDESLKRLDTDYIDLLLIHFPVTEYRKKAWIIMEEIYKAKKAKSIGVSNYTITHLKELLSECSIKPVLNQVELHVFLQQPDLIEYCKQNNIVIEAYSPLAHGEGLDNTTLIKIGEKHNKSTAQIMIRWCIEKGLIPLPKSNNNNRIKQNFEVFDFSLDKEDMNMIENLDKNLRTCWDPTDTP